MGDRVGWSRRSDASPLPARHGRGLPALTILALGLIVLGAACGGGKKKPATRAGTPAPGAPVVATPASVSTAATPAVAATAGVAATAAARTPATPRGPFTPAPSTPIPAVSPTPAAGATPGVHTENGLQIQDVQFRGRVAAAGGLRIRDKPDTSGNVVGSVPEGAMIDVEGK